jgi:hypothetical protein
MIKHSLFIVFLALSVSSFCQTNSNNKKDTVREYTVVEEMPKFPGGDEAFYQWIKPTCKASSDRFSLYSNKNFHFIYS